MKNNIRKLSNLIKDYNTNIWNSLNKTATNVISQYQQQLRKQIEKSSTLKQLQTVPLQPQKPIPNKMIHWWEWYQQLIGLNSVEEARQKVIMLQNKLVKSHEMRSNVGQMALLKNNRMREIYDQLLRIRRDDPNYVNLTIEENKNLQEQKLISEQLQLIEREEKDIFMHFTIAINEYQAAQALNAQKFKYLSFLASAIVGLLSLIMSLVYNGRRTKEMNRMLAEISERNEASFKNYWNTVKETLEDKMQKTTETHKTDEGQSEWLNYLKKASYVFSVYVLLKGIMS